MIAQGDYAQRVVFWDEDHSGPSPNGPARHVPLCLSGADNILLSVSMLAKHRDIQ